jgi:hypothetical protein
MCMCLCRCNLMGSMCHELVKRCMDSIDSFWYITCTSMHVLRRCYLCLVVWREMERRDGQPIYRCMIG